MKKISKHLWGIALFYVGGSIIALMSILRDMSKFSNPEGSGLEFLLMVPMALVGYLGLIVIYLGLRKLFNFNFSQKAFFISTFFLGSVSMFTVLSEFDLFSWVFYQENPLSLFASFLTVEFLLVLGSMLINHFLGQVSDDN